MRTVVVNELVSGKIIMGTVLWSDHELECIIMKDVFEYDDEEEEFYIYKEGCENMHSFNLNATVSSSLPDRELLEEYYERISDGKEKEELFGQQKVLGRDNQV